MSKKQTMSKITVLDYVLCGIVFLVTVFRSPVEFFRPDLSWDLLNYHLANGAGNQVFELHPSLIQSFFNPRLDQIFYPIHTEIPWPISNAILLIFPITTFFIVRNLLIPNFFEKDFNLRNATSACCMTGSFTVSEYFTQSNDLILTPLVLIGFWLLLPSSNQNWKRIFLGGVAIGLSAALKMTYLYVLIGTSLSVIIFYSIARIARSHALVFIFSSLASFFLAYAEWGITLFSATGNPFFPFFNRVFVSPMYNSSTFENNRFGMLAHPDFLLSLPIRILKREHSISELTFMDLRIPLFYLVVTFLVFWLFRKLFSVERLRNDKGINFQVSNLMILVLPSFIVWGTLLGIGRYLIPIEILITLLLIKVLTLIIFQPKYRSTLIISFCIFLAITTSHINWNYGNFESPKNAAPTMQPQTVDSGLGERSAILLLDSPTGFLKVVLKNEYNHIFLSPYFNEYNLEQQLRIIGGLPIAYVSLKNEDLESKEILNAYQVNPTNNCRDLNIEYFPDLQICSTSRFILAPVR
jgi:hypothetical protein